MDIMTFKTIVWNHYQGIEKEFIETMNYVALSADNYDTFSDKYFMLLQLLGSEIDVVSKEICHCFQLPNGNKLKNIHHYCEIISLNIPNMIQEEVWVKDLDGSIKPWEGWNFKKTKTEPTGKNPYYIYSGNAPKWWKVYNHTKHERTTVKSDKPVYKNANLCNVLNGMAALYIADLYFYSLILKKKNAETNTTGQIASIKESQIFQLVSSRKNFIADPFTKTIEFNDTKLSFKPF